MAFEVAENEAAAVHEQKERQALLRVRAIDADSDVAVRARDGAVDDLGHGRRLGRLRRGAALAQGLERDLAQRRHLRGLGQEGRELGVDGHLGSLDRSGEATAAQ